MGNEISANNSIAYYQKEICPIEDDEQTSAPVLQLDKIRFMENHDIEETSIVFLFSLDTNKDGIISVDDIEKFIRKVQAASLDPNDCDFGFKCGAFCTKELCEYLNENGKDAFKNWFETAINESFPITDGENNIKLIDRDAVKRIFDLLQIQQLLGRNFQWILDMLQRHAEANLQMNLNDPAFDDYVPLETMLCLIQQVANGMAESYTSLTKH
ncbi:hypothetical protein TRFO_26757 [Tritrichomonas foetus]|uniref:EF-hand domain-containing protein n=1 Tax=Tritrichomonas foetus TaxID=1144522 RepID=A0A1J4K270_9EUKA|nr:hypothetical protein TRFO_26757 [Tritrichomonas foetus]|eukprot:OHT05487.1 hypothetical protein TRFO_26757 [Tritrichomonas foetus]